VVVEGVGAVEAEIRHSRSLACADGLSVVCV